MSKLNDKHYRLLELLKQNKWSVEELATKTGFTEPYVNDLIVNSPNAGDIQDLFQQELRKVDSEIDARITRKTNYVREKLVNKLTQWVESVTHGSEMDTKTKHKMLVDSINAINKSMPFQVSVENYSWKPGMGVEEAISEFKRLKAMAERSAIRSRVQGFVANGSAENTILDGQAYQGGTDAQDTILPAEPEAEGLSPE